MKSLLIVALVAPILFAQEDIGPIRFHAGATPYTDASGQVWASDATYVQGVTAVSTAPLSPIGNATNIAFYQSQRISLPSGNACSAFSYLVPVPNNRYRVTFKLAELSATPRTFTANVSGANPQTIKTQVGNATDYVFYFNVTTGSLAVILSSANPNICPVMSGVEIVPQLPITQTDVTFLTQNLSTKVTQGPGFVAGAVGVINMNGQLDGVVGDPGECVLIDGTTQNCLSNSSYSDGEIPDGTIDGMNMTFTLAGIPAPSLSILLTRNGLLLTQGQDYNISGSTITFLTGATPQIGDLIQAFYRQ